MLEPCIPALHNTDGDPLLFTRVHFGIIDRAALERALDEHSSLSREDGRWSWSGPNQHGEVVSLGNFALEGSTLILEANSQARAERGAQLLKELAPSAVVQGAITHQDPEPSLREGLRAQVRGSSASSAAHGAEPPDIPPEVAEALILDHYAQHYRSWIDESIPALAGETPRAAAKKPALRAQLVQLIHGLESMYQQALRQGAPAYDPSWMWAELGLKSEDPRLPPPLPHERLAQFIDGADRLIAEVAEAQRRTPGFDDTSSLLDRDACHRLLDIQRFVKAHEPAANASDGPAWRQRALMPYLELALNFALHRRKVFWVDEALTYMLAHTDSDMPADDLRAPFSSFALVFTDRHVLSLAERLLSKRAGSALAGLILRVATVYVSERWHDSGRTLELCFAFDALGDDLPELVHHTLTCTGNASVQTLLPQAELGALTEPPLETKTTSPLRALLQVVVNALLYATSHGVEPELRSGTQPRATDAKKTAAHNCTSESVYFLPGTIEIQQVRALQALAQVGEGREALRRCMVRGHWRRAAQNWSDQRLRWISPYWKGPDMAAVIERAYRLKP